jgi:translation initiation factor IF-2
VNEVEGGPEESLEAVVVETGKDKRGPTASVVLRSGVLRVGERIFSEIENIKVRGIFDGEGGSVREVSAGKPALILGFRDLPRVGSLIASEGTTNLEKRKTPPKRANVGDDEIAVVIKAQNAGSLEAVIANIPPKTAVISSGIGDVAESDIFMAKSSEAYLLVFESNISSAVKKLAETEGVEMFKYEIIYKLFEKLEELIEEKKVKILGEAEILASFPFNKKRVAGSRIKKGVIKKGDKLTLFRKDVEIAKSRVVSIKKQKEGIQMAKEGEECGILLAPQLDFEIGDMLVSVAEPKK